MFHAGIYQTMQKGDIVTCIDASGTQVVEFGKRYRFVRNVRGDAHGNPCCAVQDLVTKEIISGMRTKRYAGLKDYIRLCKSATK